MIDIKYLPPPLDYIHPKKRSTIDGILNHPWISSIQSNQNIETNEMKNLTELIKKEFESKNNKFKSWFILEIKYRDDGDKYKKIIKYNISSSSEENKVFDSHKKPKNIPDYFGEKF